MKSALLAGLVAGGAASGFHFFLTEPLIDRAIEIEKGLGQAQGEALKEPVVSRPAQKAGLVLGLLLYGGAWGLLLGVVLHLSRDLFPPWSDSRCGLTLAAVLGWSAAVFPFLKYPANPPGVGDPETIGYRQLLFLSFLALSVIGTALFFRLLSFPSLRRNWIWPVLGYILYLVLIYLLLPGNPDAVEMPPDIVWNFRVLSLTGLLLFWGVLGGAFAWLSSGKTSHS
ncbi:MAG: CbtA family protein [Deltaproteobacteria bacterium]|nr:CbtA family protein [Deltaproteobacteria bacterium]